ncbi:hypothetical protein [Streptomyces sp. AP-93]|nr:hypothetical protein [Streptomyces sp. AP-93]
MSDRRSSDARGADIAPGIARFYPTKRWIMKSILYAEQNKKGD